MRAISSAATGALALSLLMARVDAAPQGVIAYDTGTLAAGDPAPWSRFGAALSISGDTVVAGAASDDEAGMDAGAVYVFVHDGSAWTQQAKLMASDAAPDDRFGSAVAIDGERLVVGSPFDDDVGSSAGSAYVFTRAAGVWTEEAKLTASDAAAGDELGSSVALSGGRAALGAPGDTPSGPFSGSAYVFLRAGTTWLEEAKVVGSPSSVLSFFGVAIALDGDRLVVGADGFGRGAYVYDRSGSSWPFVERLLDPAGTLSDRYGGALSVSGERVAVGSPRNDDDGPDAGSVFVFAWSGTAWELEANLVAGESLGELGSAVDLDGDLLVAGARFDYLEGDTAAGAAYLFERTSAGAWLQRAQLLPEAPSFLGDFGAAVGVDGLRLVVGGPGDDSGGTNAGSARGFAVVPGPFTYCFGDGSGAPCPCGNEASNAGGCKNSQGFGAELASLGVPSVAQDGLRFAGQHLPPSQPALLFVGDNATGGGAGISFGDGLRCAGGGVVRLGITLPDAVGHAQWGPGLGATGGWGTADVKRFQCWYRDPQGSACGSAFSLTNGVEVVFVP